MLEIIAIIFLVKANKKNAIERGRRPGAFIALTLALWIGLEIIGVIVGTAAGAEYLGIIFLGLAFAGIGGLISYLVTKSCKPGDYYPVPPMASYMPMPPMGAPYAPPAPPAQPLDTPAMIEIVRDYSLKGDITSWKFILNGETVGSLGNGATRSTTTKVRQNTLRAVSDDGLEFMPLQFDIESGGHAEIHFKGDRFERESCTGIQPMSMPAAPPPSAYAPPVILRAEPLAAPARIDIVRDSHKGSEPAVWNFVLNGYMMGSIGDGQTMTVTTGQQQNVLRALPDNGVEPPPMMFGIQSGGVAEIHFKNGAFLPDESGGIVPPQTPPAYAPSQMPPPYGPTMYAPQMPPPYGPGPYAPAAPATQPEPQDGTTCTQCGAPVNYKDQYCRKCGAKQPGAEQL